MIEKTIQWFRNNWFLWIILIAGYIAIRAFGYDVKIINSSNDIIVKRKINISDF
jgi:hypothetical protein